jgi:hypothetical protein
VTASEAALRATMAILTSFGAATTRKLAAVIMPRVPSAHVVSSRVLSQGANSVPDRSIGQDHFQAQYLVARRSIAQHIRAPGVCRNVAADLAAALGRKTQRKHPVHGQCCRLQVCEDAARIRNNREIVRVD